MQIFIKTVAGRIFPLDVENSDTVHYVKRRIEDIERRTPDSQRLTLLGKQLEDDKTLADCGVGKESTLHLVIRLRGGGFSTHFVDLENKDALQRIAFTYGQGQEWSKISSGLNMEGKCTQSSCAAYAKRVISQMQFCDFDITTGRSTCPLCLCAIEASTCGFTDCQWMHSGRKRGSADEITSEWQVTGDEYERFREAGNAWPPGRSVKPTAPPAESKFVAPTFVKEADARCFFGRQRNKARHFYGRYSSKDKKPYLEPFDEVEADLHLKILERRWFGILGCSQCVRHDSAARPLP